MDERNTLVVQYRPLACKIALEFCRRYYTLAKRIGSDEDVMQESQVELIGAAERFDPERGFTFLTYATHRIKWRLISIAKNHGLIRVPVYLWEADKQPKSPATLAAADRARTCSRMPCWHDGSTRDPLAAELPDILESEECRQLARTAIGELSETERHILHRRFGLDGNEPEMLKTIGQSLGMTKEGVRQAQRRALEKLRSRLESCA